jgi:hypothetical protein
MPLGHWQSPFWQVWPLLQTVPQVPQLLLSFSVPLAQAQLPFWQVCPFVHWLPQAPQWVVVVRSVQVPLQQPWFAPQACWQAPQLSGSL